MDAVHKRPTERLDPRRAKHRVADILVDQLVKAGVEVIFGIPGGAIAALYDALLDRPEIRVITSRHEGGAMFAAAGYARTTGKLGVVAVTSGPGVLNCMTGLATAYADNVPLLVLAGEVPVGVQGRGALQEGSASFLNVVGMASNITKLALEVRNANQAPAALLRAVTTASTGRGGPVLLTLPLDVMTTEIRRPGISSRIEVKYEIDGTLLEKVSLALWDAESPVILAGSGARVGEGPRALRRLAERLQAPVMTTLKGKGVFPETHSLSLGVFGYGAHPSTREYLKKGIDVVLAVGTALTDTATSGWAALEPTRHFIQIDAEALHMSRTYPVTVGLVGRADTLLERLLGNLPRKPRATRVFGIRRFSDAEHSESADAIIPQRAIWELQQVAPADAIYTCDIGEHLLFAVHYLTIDNPDAFVTMTGLASMGGSIPAAMGAKLGNPAKAVLAICGDGAFAMSLSAVATAAQAKVPITIAVMNDRRYGMVEYGNESIYGRTPPYPTDELNIAMLAKSLGADSCVVAQRGQLESIELPTRRPLVIDVRIDPTERMPTHERFDFLAEKIGSRP